MIKSGDAVRASKPLRVREAQRDARARKTWLLVEVEVTDAEIEDGIVKLARNP